MKRSRRLRQLHRTRKHPAFFVPAITFGVLMTAGVIALLIINKGDPTPTLSVSNSKVVIIRHDGQEQFIPTQAKTVGDLLKKLEIKLNEGDVVEPAVATEIVSDNFRVNVYRALPVTIMEGGKETRALSAATTPRSIARQAGIQAYPEDELKLKPVDDFVTEGVVGQTLTINRSTPVNLNLYGTPITARTLAKTVGEFLKEKNITLGEGETVQPDINSPISATEPIFVNRKGVTVQTISEKIPFDTEFVEDKSLSFGVTAVRQQGTPGTRIVTYQINTETGQRAKFQEIVIQNPVNQVVARGSYVNIPNDKQGVMAAAGISSSDYTYVDYIVSRESGWRVNATNGRTWGLCQALPGSKMSSAGSDWQTNPVTQLRWCSGYAKGRYGSWSAAYSFWTRNHWW